VHLFKSNLKMPRSANASEASAAPLEPPVWGEGGAIKR